jgi:glutathione reductase (NADPH)
VGGGYIACEFAGILNGLGVQTHLWYRGEAVLRGFDTEARDVIVQGHARAWCPDAYANQCDPH